MRTRVKPGNPLLFPQPPWLFENSGAFETCAVKGGEILHLKEHLLRLRGSLKTLGISFDREEELKKELKEAAKKVQGGFIRAAVRREEESPFLIYSHRGAAYPKELYRRGARVVTAPTRQGAPEAAPGGAKSSQRLSSILSRLEGLEALEVLRLGHHGTLTEGTVSNLFIVREGTLMTPPPWTGVLEGVMRSHVLEKARGLPVPVKETPLTRHDLFNAEEAFLTNVLMGILPIREADGRAIGAKIPGSVTKRLMGAF
ncbi:MAG: aminotransferase class IV [Candidatus Omnitrophica bacterium]|nr:aminotransferase class IV [Candidatus Omnitrophota bacterium]